MKAPAVMRESTPQASPALTRRYPIGAEVRQGGTHFRIWAPVSRAASVTILGHDDRTIALSRPADDGYFEGLVEDVGAGTRYWVELDGARYPDPASRFQPEGPHGPSEVIDGRFAWSDDAWQGIREITPIVYELHAGTFTSAGTWDAAGRHLAELADLGVSVIEILPVAEFPGRFGWGYDGVLWFAPSHLYGRPDDLRRFVNDAHSHGIGVILDVVYNHFGPDGCVIDKFSPAYLAEDTEWGQGLNFDGPGSQATRDFVVANAAYWIDEFHLDGLRLDATQAIKDSSRPHILADVRRAVAERAGSKRTWVVGENEPQDTTLLRRIEDGGCGLDALWNDDFHHAAMVALTGRREAYYTDYFGRPQEFISCAKRGFLYQGQWYSWQHQPRGRTARDLPSSQFVAFLQNHDQVANSLAGERVHVLTSPGRLRAMTALLILGPWPVMLFQGQEFQASAPFLYFADHHNELGAAVVAGRREFLAQFPSLVDAPLPDPTAFETFERCKLDESERERHTGALALHTSLIRLRRSDPAFHVHDRFAVDGAVLDERAFVLRFIDRDATPADASAERLLVVNLGPELLLPTLADPLLSPFPARRWRAIWASDDPAFGGLGIAEFQVADGWRLSPESALVLAPDVPEAGR